MSDSPGRMAVNAHTTPFLPYDMEGPGAAGDELAPAQLRRARRARARTSCAWSRARSRSRTTMRAWRSSSILEGDLVDSDGTVFGPGDFVSYDAGTHHNSWTEDGCLIAVFEWQAAETRANSARSIRRAAKRRPSGIRAIEIALEISICAMRRAASSAAPSRSSKRG